VSVVAFTICLQWSKLLPIIMNEFEVFAGKRWDKISDMDPDFSTSLTLQNSFRVIVGDNPEASSRLGGGSV